MVDRTSLDELSILIVDDDQENGEAIAAAVVSAGAHTVTWLRLSPFLEPDEIDNPAHPARQDAVSRLGDVAPGAKYVPFRDEHMAAAYVEGTYNGKKLLVFCDLNLGTGPQAAFIARLVALIGRSAESGCAVFVVVHSAQIDNPSTSFALTSFSHITGHFHRWDKSLSDATGEDRRQRATELAALGLGRWYEALDPSVLWWPSRFDTDNPDKHFVPRCSGSKSHDWISHDYRPECASCRAVTKREFARYLESVLGERQSPDEWLADSQLPGLHAEMKCWVSGSRALTLGAVALLAARSAPHATLAVKWSDLVPASPLVENQSRPAASQLLTALIADDGLLAVLAKDRDDTPLLNKIVLEKPARNGDAAYSRSIRLYLSPKEPFSSDFIADPCYRKPNGKGNLSTALRNVERALVASDSGRVSRSRINLRQLSNGTTVVEFVECGCPGT